jgi:hypothetical protein
MRHEAALERLTAQTLTAHSQEVIVSAPHGESPVETIARNHGILPMDLASIEARVLTAMAGMGDACRNVSSVMRDAGSAMSRASEYLSHNWSGMRIVESVHIPNNHVVIVPPEQGHSEEYQARMNRMSDRVREEMDRQIMQMLGLAFSTQEVGTPQPGVETLLTQGTCHHSWETAYDLGPDKQRCVHCKMEISTNHDTVLQPVALPAPTGRRAIVLDDESC